MIKIFSIFILIFLNYSNQKIKDNKQKIENNNFDNNKILNFTYNSKIKAFIFFDGEIHKQKNNETILYYDIPNFKIISKKIREKGYFNIESNKLNVKLIFEGEKEYIMIPNKIEKNNTDTKKNILKFEHKTFKKNIKNLNTIKRIKIIGEDDDTIIYSLKYFNVKNYNNLYMILIVLVFNIIMSIFKIKKYNKKFKKNIIENKKIKKE
jgi:hypothetical protein